MGSTMVASSSRRLVCTQDKVVIPVNSTTTLVPPISAPRMRTAGPPSSLCHPHTFLRWTRRQDPITPTRPCKPENTNKSPTTPINTPTNRWRITRCRRQHPKSHRDAKNECPQTWPSMARILGARYNTIDVQGIEEWL